MAEIINFDQQFVESKERQKMLTYHHSRPLSAVTFGEVVQSPAIASAKNPEDAEDAEWFEQKYRWLEKQIGFYPLFMAVGRRNDDLRMTGYQNQWRKVLSRSREGNTYRKRGQIDNNVLFSYVAPPDKMVFTDYDIWNVILSMSKEPESKLVQSLLKPSWIKNDWITKANKEPESVQVLVPKLDLSLANSVMVRNEKTKRELEKMGFKNVLVARLKLEESSN